MNQCFGSELFRKLKQGDVPMTRSRIFGAALLTASLGLSLALPANAAMSPFRAMAGSWSGGGALSLANGEQERLRCHAAYDVGGGGNELRLNLRCASASYNFDLASSVAYRDGAISG